LLIPAHNEEQVIAACVAAARAVDYPLLEVLVLDDGSSDETVAVATEAGRGDERIVVVPDPVNRGKADRLNLGFAKARYDFVAVTDADTHVHPLAMRLLVARLTSSPRLAAVAGAPHVTNRTNLLCAMQIIEAASIIGLIRRTQALTGRVGVVAGVLGLFRKDAVQSVGGYRGEMATEDIDLSWRLLLDGWHTSYEPAALVGMQVPARLPALWAQRRRWARGQGEVLHVHFRRLLHPRHWTMWPVAFEAFASLVWILCLTTFVALQAIHLIGFIAGIRASWTALGLAWGVAVAVVATLQLSFALRINFPHDRRAPLAFLLGPIYPVAYWALSAVASVRSEVPAILRGPADARVVWDIPREQL
jgi:biofilm PGA synthesis N-glycosyltransferase PgaC